MPRLDGLAATKEIMITAPTPIVIVTGSTRAREVAESLEALRAGALEVLVKPLGPGSPGFSAAARQIVATVKAMAQVKVVRHYTTAGSSSSSLAVATDPSSSAVAALPCSLPLPRRGRRPCGCRVKVAVATSTGGPAALQRIFGGLPGHFPLPILVVQHITPGFTLGLAEWLDSVCPLRVKVASHGETLESGTAYLAPDDRHLGVPAGTAGGEAIRGSDALRPWAGFRPSATVLFVVGRLDRLQPVIGRGPDPDRNGRRRRDRPPRHPQGRRPRRRAE